MTRKDEKFLSDLLTETADAKKPQIIPEVKYILVKIGEPKQKYDKVVMKKEPKIHLDSEPLPDLNAYDDWIQKKLKTERFPDIKPKTEIIFPDIKLKT